MTRYDNKTILKNWLLKMMGNSIKSSEKVEYISAIFIKSIKIIFVFSIFVTPYLIELGRPKRSF
jgi:hypothetical protein